MRSLLDEGDKLMARVDAFEPQAEGVRNLRAYGATFAHDLTVHDVALSGGHEQRVLAGAAKVRRDQTSLLGEVDDAVFEERYINMFVFRPR